jgi:hypothetical protein
MKWKHDATMGEIFDAAMAIVDEKEAASFLEDLVAWHMKKFSVDETTATEDVRSNLGYFAGYYDDSVRVRIERLFKCKHPVFGAIAETGPIAAEEAFEMGLKGRMKRTEKK